MTQVYYGLGILRRGPRHPQSTGSELPVRKHAELFCAAGQRATYLGEITPHATAFKVAKHYDQDGNGKITQEAFDVGVKKLGACLGGACPLYSWSSAAKASVFASPEPTVTTLFPALGTSAFHAALVVANYSELQPFTYRTLAIDRKSGVLSFNWSIRLEASAGEIRVELSNTSTYAQLVNNTLRYVAPQESAPLGARLIPADSEALMKLRDQYGDASTGR